MVPYKPALFLKKFHLFLKQTDAKACSTLGKVQFHETRGYMCEWVRVKETWRKHMTVEVMELFWVAVVQG